MPVPEAVRRVAELSPRSGTTFVGPDGIRYRVVALDERTEPPDAEARAAELDSQIRATLGIVTALAQQVEGMIARVDEALRRAQGALEQQERFAEVAAALATELARNRYSRPIYDAQGRLIGAERVGTVEELTTTKRS